MLKAISRPMLKICGDNFSAKTKQKEIKKRKDYKEAPQQMDSYTFFFLYGNITSVFNRCLHSLPLITISLLESFLKLCVKK
jgi:hypothetical protein